MSDSVAVSRYPRGLSAADGTVLPVGDPPTDGQVLTYDESGAVLAFADPSGGGVDLAASYTWTGTHVFSVDAYFSGYIRPGSPGIVLRNAGGNRAVLTGGSVDGRVSLVSTGGSPAVLVLGSGTASGAAIKGDGATVAARLGDDSGYAALAVGALRHSATAAATTPGTVTRRMPVYDSGGVLLGYVPIYDAIT